MIWPQVADTVWYWCLEHPESFVVVSISDGYLGPVCRSHDGVLELASDCYRTREACIDAQIAHLEEMKRNQ